MISSILASYFSFKVPLFDIKGTEFLAAFFILTGYLYKKSGFRLEDNVMYLPIFIIIVVFGEIFWRSSMENLSFATIIPFTVSALAGIIMTLTFSKTCFKSVYLKRVLTFIGDHTLQVLTWHFLFFRVVSSIVVKINNLHINQIAEHPVISEYSHEGWWFFYTIVGVGGPTISLYLLELLKKYYYDFNSNGNV